MRKWRLHGVKQFPHVTQLTTGGARTASLVSTVRSTSSLHGTKLYWFFGPVSLPCSLLFFSIFSLPLLQQPKTRLPPLPSTVGLTCLVMWANLSHSRKRLLSTHAKTFRIIWSSFTDKSITDFALPSQIYPICLQMTHLLKMLFDHISRLQNLQQFFPTAY